jgi:hypothetical protein
VVVGRLGVRRLRTVGQVVGATDPDTDPDGFRRPALGPHGRFKVGDHVSRNTVSGVDGRAVRYGEWEVFRGRDVVKFQ